MVNRYGSFSYSFPNPLGPCPRYLYQALDKRKDYKKDRDPPINTVHI